MDTLPLIRRHESGGGLSEHLFARPAGNGQRVVVYKKVLALKIEHGGRQLHLFEETAESPLRLAQCLIGHFAVRDVALAALHPDLLSGIVAERAPGGGRPLRAAIAGDQAVLFILEPATLKQGIPIAEHPRLVVRMNPVAESCPLPSS